MVKCIGCMVLDADCRRTVLKVCGKPHSNEVPQSLEGFYVGSQTMSRQDLLR